MHSEDVSKNIKMCVLWKGCVRCHYVFRCHCFVTLRASHHTCMKLDSTKTWIDFSLIIPSEFVFNPISKWFRKSFWPADQPSDAIHQTNLSSLQERGRPESIQGTWWAGLPFEKAMGCLFSCTQTDFIRIEELILICLQKELRFQNEFSKRKIEW